MSVRVAILGTRGIPNLYGGFEQCAEMLSQGLVRSGYRVTVYNPDWHPYESGELGGVQIRKRYCPEKKLGPLAHFIYDGICLWDAMRSGADVVIELGYQSSSLSLLLLRPFIRAKVITNMDGLEWKRAKWSPAVRRATQFFERLGVRFSDSLVADNGGIADYLKEQYGADSATIAYGVDYPPEFDDSVLEEHNLVSGQFALVIARLEPENNIELVLQGHADAGVDLPVIVVGGTDTLHGKMLTEQFASDNVRFVGGIYDQPKLNSLRQHSAVYFHGHSVGGTNPSLIEAMAAGSLIAAHDNPFNRSVLENTDRFFSGSDDVVRILEATQANESSYPDEIEKNKSTINKKYNWDYIVEQYAREIDRVLEQP